MAIEGIETRGDLERFVRDLGLDRIDALLGQAGAAGPSLGDVKATAVSSTGAGWIACDGSALTTSSPYQTLRTKLIADGSPFGVSGSDPLLPNPQGRAIIGSGSGAGLTARALGASIGAEAHLLTAAESGLREHTHTYSVPGAINAGASPNAINAGALNQANTGGVGGGLANSNAQQTHNNMQPSLALKIWIYAGA